MSVERTNICGIIRHGEIIRHFLLSTNVNKLEFFSQNLKYLRKSRGLSQSEMLTELGFERTTWGGYETGKSKPSLDDFIKIADYFGISEYDLLHKNLVKGEDYKNVKAGKNTKFSEDLGEDSGEVKVKKYQFTEDFNQAGVKEKEPVYNLKMPQVITVDTEGNENVVLVPVRARAGYLNGYNDPEFVQQLPAYRLPGLNHGTYRLFEVEGLSMYPTLHAGDLIIGQNIDRLQDVRDDRVHVIVTKNDGVVVKRVLNRIVKDRKLILKSDNYKDRELYPNIVCDPEDVLEIWYATGFISRQMRPPAETYNRVVDLEGRLTLVEELLKKGLIK